MGITLDTKCIKCGVTLRRQMCLAMLIDFGNAKTSADPSVCPEGGDHIFEDDDLCTKDCPFETFRKV